MALQIAILGSFEARVNGVVAGVPAGKQRALLTLLAVRAPQPVSAESAAEALWPRAAPADAMRNLQVTVSRLRRSLAGVGSAVETLASGYRLAVEADAIDARRFEALIREARAVGVERDPAAAQGLLDDALALWRGPPLADVSYESFAQAEIARLEELRVTALEERIDARLTRGEHALLVAELELLSAEYPSRERLLGLLILTLYRCGRQTEALEVYTRRRRWLVEELGLEPSPTLHDLHQAILEHRVELLAPMGAASAAHLRRRALPAAADRTFGRAHDVDSVRELLRNRSVRLVTLTGPGGVGKTRLAVEVARTLETDFTDGAHFVALDALQRPEDVPSAFVKALGIILLSGESTAQAVERFLDGKHLLLVVDNCEHVLAAAPFIGGLPGACPAVTLLATSREPLAVRAEQRYPVSPLALPELETPQDTESLACVHAIALFCERARAHDPRFQLGDDNAAAVAEICKRLDGLPLAIELAAARCALLSPGEIAERLQAALGALGAGARDAPARQQTLGATIDWSHELLGDREKQCFARFAVFRGGATVAAAESITGAGLDTLDRVVAKNLLVRRQQPQAPTRLRMLETIRSYAAERFAATADEHVIRDRHVDHYLALAQRHGSPQAVWGRSRKEHLARLDDDIDNVHSALDWVAGKNGAHSELELCAAVGMYWLMRDRYADAVGRIDHALSKPAAGADLALRVRVLVIRSLALFPMGRKADTSAGIVEAEALARRLAEPALLSQVLQIRASDETGAARLDVAETVAEEARYWAEASGDQWAIAMAAFAKAMAAASAAELRERVDRATLLLEDVGNVYQLADLLASAAYGALQYGSDQDAREFVSRAIPLTRELDSSHVWMLLSGNIGLTALLTDDTDAAREAFREELRLCRELVVLPFASEGLFGLAAVAANDGELDRAARLCGASAAHRYGAWPRDSVDARVETTFLEPARARHGTDAWEAAMRAGAALSFEDAITFALEEPLD
jgi:predicted ATPase/DNA-binding SARP family transcriptional activator